MSLLTIFYRALAIALVFGLLQTATAEGQPLLDMRGATAEPDLPPTAVELAAPTRVVVLGTGTPIQDPNRGGPSIAIIHKGESYLFDVGSGAVQNAVRARHKYNIPSLNPNSVRAVFLTHLHSDHIADLPALSSILWWMRTEKLKLFGPAGIEKLAAGIETFYTADTDLRVNGIQPVANPTSYQLELGVVKAGLVFEKDDLTVEAFAVPHGTIKPAFGYKITTQDKVIVISGDTAFSQELIAQGQGADLLFHEVVSAAGLARRSKKWQSYHRAAHTVSTDVARVAKATKPGKLVLYHGLFFGALERSVIDEIRAAGYAGDLVLANDLDIFE